MSILWRTLVTLVLLHESFSRKFSPGPSVDPGVFVITHIRTCRNGAGYCILGFSCEVDKDFIKDDLGGHCNGLGAAFNPKASFVCCRENPELHAPQEVPAIVAGNSNSQDEEDEFSEEVVIEAENEVPSPAVITETSVATEIVTETFTEIIQPVTEIVMVTKVEEVTEEILHPGIVDDVISDPAYRNEPDTENLPQFVLLSTSEDEPVELPDKLPDELPNELPHILEDTSVTSMEILSETHSIESMDKHSEPTDNMKQNEDQGGSVENINEQTIEPMDQSDNSLVDKWTQNWDLSDDNEDEDLSLKGLISTSPTSLKPDRDDSFGSVLASTQSTIRSSATNNAGSMLNMKEDILDTAEYNIEEFAILDSTQAQSDVNRDSTQFLRYNAEEDESSNTEPELRSESVRSSQCGRLGGAAVLQAFGRAADNLLPDLVFSWITGGQSNQKKPTARLDDEEELLEPRIIAGDVTSTVLFCWMAAIMEITKEGESNQFICTGALVEPDLVVTSASCTLRMFETGVNGFEVVLGDSNLNIDLPFGVQNHEISQVIVHENYRPDDSFHYEDIGLIKLKTNAKMETTVCMLCLPETTKDYVDENCTVVGYGRPSAAAINEFNRDKSDLDFTDGILRKANLPIVDTILCQEFLDVNARSDDMHSGFICAGGEGKEESCYIAMDGGSPLACQKDKDHYELAGLVTFGTSCSQDQSPSLFTNVSKHTKWIKENYATMK